MNIGWNLVHTYGSLPGYFYTEQKPTPVKSPKLVQFNDSLAKSLDLDTSSHTTAEWAALLSGNELPPGAFPIAQAYSGHQFGHFTTLGDGRAILLGEQVTASGERFDVQLKGSGQTPYSRRGDGRAALGPMLREYLISEAMHALGVPTTRSLAVLATGEDVYREEILPGAVLTRIAASHLRVGTFEHAARTAETALVRELADYTIDRHYPEVRDVAEPYFELLLSVIKRQAILVAKWMQVGFIHGVMNTDNMTICGETIDYGPCAFMDQYDPATVFSSIDRQGRYAYANQPVIAHWNLAVFAETLLPLLGPSKEAGHVRAREALATFSTFYEEHWLSGMASKLGLDRVEPDDFDLIVDLLAIMERLAADYTNTFRNLSERGALPETLAPDDQAEAWQQRWSIRLLSALGGREESLERMRRINPAIIPRNHQVEVALNDAFRRSDLSKFRDLLAAVTRPFAPIATDEKFRMPPKPNEVVRATYCGT